MLFNIFNWDETNFHLGSIVFNYFHKTIYLYENQQCLIYLIFYSLEIYRSYESLYCFMQQLLLRRFFYDPSDKFIHVF